MLLKARGLVIMTYCVYGNAWSCTFSRNSLTTIKTQVKYVDDWNVTHYTIINTHIDTMDIPQTATTTHYNRSFHHELLMLTKSVFRENVSNAPKSTAAYIGALKRVKTQW